MYILWQTKYQHIDFFSDLIVDIRTPRPVTECKTRKVASGQDLNCSSDAPVTHCHAAELQVCTVVDTSESEKVSAAGTAKVTLQAFFGLSEQKY